MTVWVVHLCTMIDMTSVSITTYAVIKQYQFCVGLGQSSRSDSCKVLNGSLENCILDGAAVRVSEPKC